MAEKQQQGGGTAEPGAGAPSAAFAAAIEAEHQMMIDPAREGVVSWAGVPTWAPGDPVAAAHPGFGQLLADGLLVPVRR